MEENRIELKLITELLGQNFYIPAYQRGYRWTSINVRQLLDDVWDYRQHEANRNHFYCLQPVVVRQATWQDIDGNSVAGYELIDGQQRLTTLHRIITYLCKNHLRTDLTSEGYLQNLFNIYYETRLESRAFLETENTREDVPDLYYMSQAYTCIMQWFEDPQRGIPRQVRDEMLKVLLPGLLRNENGEVRQPEWSVKVIWYEITDENQESEALFTRLNRGKIPLTSAELIKAKFVNSDSFTGMMDPDKIRRRTQLIQLWEEIENQLNNPAFWAFIADPEADVYANRIEYLFDIYTEKKSDEADPLFSFVKFFQHRESAETLSEKWQQIEEIYRALTYWFADKNLYHMVGFLIATGGSIRTLVEAKKTRTKSEFETYLGQRINDKIPENWEDLSYQLSGDHARIKQVLLLVNVELTRKNSNANHYFPFEWYKRANLSIEHIHAQNIDGISSIHSDQWKNWLDNHLRVLPEIAVNKDQAAVLENTIREQWSRMTFANFERWSSEILGLIPNADGDAEEMEFLHRIENLALLGISENIKLSNSVFEVKRRKVVEMDKEGAFIPPATKRIFLKYYTKDQGASISIWTSVERSQYLEEMRSIVCQYKNEREVAHA